ncbi:uncharacterized protein LOC131646133 isoform X3 [Vicia villosa]|uniref:uncharacterized protein LOC131646133 isoform X3 n=1 Tax=Vicia villosa TaxID=3911 RepID=UPI00273C6F32|nr:uncharacterized protein LOC131646133 isoform X3 [Vicia villosa]
MKVALNLSLSTLASPPVECSCVFVYHCRFGSSVEVSTQFRVWIRAAFSQENNWSYKACQGWLDSRGEEMFGGDDEDDDGDDSSVFLMRIRGNMMRRRVKGRQPRVAKR